MQNLGEQTKSIMAFSEMAYFGSVLPSVTRLVSMEADGAPFTPPFVPPAVPPSLRPSLRQCSVLRVFKPMATPPPLG